MEYTPSSTKMPTGKPCLVWRPLAVLTVEFAYLSYTAHSGLPEDLRKWLIPVPGKGVVRDLLTLNISFSAGGAYFAFDKDGTIRDNLPQSFEAALQQRMTPQGNWRSTSDLPDCVSFGPNGAYCMVTRGGGGCWNFNRRMPDLHNFLSQSKSLQGIVRGHFQPSCSELEHGLTLIFCSGPFSPLIMPMFT